MGRPGYKSSTAKPADPLSIMDEAAKAVAAFNSIRQQLVDTGWSDDQAREIVVHMITRS